MISPAYLAPALAATQVEWPHAFARLKAPADAFPVEYDSNHCHAVYGHWTEALVQVAKMLGIDFKVFGPGTGQLI